MKNIISILSTIIIIGFLSCSKKELATPPNAFVPIVKRYTGLVTHHKSQSCYPGSSWTLDTSYSGTVTITDFSEDSTNIKFTCIRNLGVSFSPTGEKYVYGSMSEYSQNVKNSVKPYDNDSTVGEGFGATIYRWGTELENFGDSSIHMSSYVSSDGWDCHIKDTYSFDGTLIK